MSIIEENVQVPEKNKETPQSKVVIHQVEDLNSIRDKYPYEIFIKDKLPNIDKQSQKKYSKALKLSKNIVSLAFFQKKLWIKRKYNEKLCGYMQRVLQRI